jgi:hypothetical protein
MEALSVPERVVATQQTKTTMPAVARRLLWADQPPWGWRPAVEPPVPSTTSRTLCIQGVTRDGKPFRPSDWAERLAGAMSSFRPPGSAGGIAAFIGYSPYCVPRVIDGVKSVIVDPELRAVEPMAWDFVMNFARDNNLVVVEPPSGR